ncbi:MAG TPA: response regulator [Chryseosolibacter sp.]|nr:response regulator [Chryseosolibacter sp.]
MVLLNIDDDPEDLDFFFRAVKTINPLAKCLLARNAKEALNILRDTLLPDYIFLDIRMPILDGKTVLQELRKNRKLKSVPVIMYSTSINQKDIEEYSSLGANQFVNKSNDFKGLCETLRQFLK